jgi:hypothetical protein
LTPSGSGTAGTNGSNAYVNVGTTTTLAPGSSAYVENVGTESNAVFNFGIPQGIQGNTGAQGASGLNCDLTIGSVTTLAAGSQATATNSGTVNSVILNLGIPQGIQGIQGQKGEKGDKGDSTVASEIAAAVAASSAAAASSSAIASASSAAQSAASAIQAETAAASINNTFNARIEALEDKTEAQYRYTDAGVANHTQFTHYLEVVDGYQAVTITMNGIDKTISTGDISIDGDNQKITIGASQEMNGVQLVSPSVWCNNLDARQTAESINIGGTSSGGINIGNPLLPILPINFYGTVNFGFNNIIGTGINQWV